MTNNPTQPEEKEKCPKCGWYKYAEWNKDGDFCQCPSNKPEWEKELKEKVLQHFEGLLLTHFGKDLETMAFLQLDCLIRDIEPLFHQHDIELARKVEKLESDIGQVVQDSEGTITPTVNDMLEEEIWNRAINTIKKIILDEKAH